VRAASRTLTHHPPGRAQIDIFQRADVAHSRTLGMRELRRVLANVRKIYETDHKGAVPGIDALMAFLDQVLNSLANLIPPYSLHTIIIQ
jgi:hypothetical protein